MIGLSEGTRQRLDALFTPDDRSEAAAILEHDVAGSLPLLSSPATPASLERIRFAALRLSEGDLDKLRYAAQVAQRDWRDVLVAAGFGNDIRAHENWWPDSRAAD